MTTLGIYEHMDQTFYGIRYRNRFLSLSTTAEQWEDYASVRYELQDDQGVAPWLTGSWDDAVYVCDHTGGQHPMAARPANPYADSGECTIVAFRLSYEE